MRRRSVLATAALLVLSGTASAQDYPERPITMIVPFAAGGPTDTVARLIAEPMTATLGQQVIVENVGGAGGTLGAGRVANGRPGRLHAAAAPYRPGDQRLALPQAALRPGRGLRPDRPGHRRADDDRRRRPDFEPDTIGELIEYVKTNKDKVTFANAGIGSASHLCGMLLMDALDTPMTTVPYKGTGPAMTDLLGGQVDLMCDQTTNTTRQIKGGKIKAYAVTTAERGRPSLPDLPTLARGSGLPGFEVAVWHGLYAPAGTPERGGREAAAALQAALKDDQGDRALRRSRHRAGRPEPRHAGGAGRSSSRPRSPSGGRSSRRRASTPTDGLRPEVAASASRAGRWTQGNPRRTSSRGSSSSPSALPSAMPALGYEIGSATRMGPGFFPLVLARILTVLGAIIVFKGITRTIGEPGGSDAWFAGALLVAALVVFGLTVRGLGLVPALLIAVFMSAFASRRTGVGGSPP